MAPTPGDNILIIYTADPYNVTFKNNIVAALNAINAPFGGTPSITQISIPVGEKNGFADNIPSADKAGYLTQFCQIWDLRFMAGHNSSTYSGTIQEDSVTSGCATCDSELLLGFLRNGGHLYMQGDHLEYYARNETLMSFLLAATGRAISYPGVNPSTVYWNTYDNTAPDNFQSNYDGVNIGQLGSYYPGYIPSGGWGGGKALVKDGANNAFALLWDTPQLAVGNGKLAAVFDTNTFASDANIPGANDWQRFVQHMYTTLSTCYNYQLTKTASTLGPVCVGDPVAFTLCVNNTGTRALPAQTLWDTIPACFSYGSASPAPASGSGNYRVWNVPGIAAGASYCVTVNTNANSNPCP